MRLGMVLAVLLLLLVASPPSAVGAATGDDQYTLAANHYAHRRWDLAASEFQKLLQDHPGHPQRAEALFYRGESLLQLARYGEATESFAAFLKQAPDHVRSEQARFRQGEASYLAADYTQAEQCFVSFLDAHEDHPQASLARAYLGGTTLAIAELEKTPEKEDLARAAKFFRQSLEDDAEGPLAETCRFGLARSEHLRGLHESASAEYARLRDSDDASLSAQSHYYLGDIQSAAGQHKAASETYEALIASEAPARWTNAVLGLAVFEHAAAGNFDAARKALDRWQSRTAGPLDRHLLQQTARLARETQQTEWAIALYQILADTATEPTTGADSLEEVAQTQMEAGQHAEAEATLKKLIEKTNDDCRTAAATFLLAKTQEQLSRPADALASYLAIERQWAACATATQATREAARLLVAEGEPERAAELYARLATGELSAEETASALYSWAWVLADLGRSDEAADKFLRLHEQHAESAYWDDATYRLAESLLQRGKPEDARELLAKLLTGEMTTELQAHALYLDGRAAGSMRNWDSMQQTLTQLLAEFPSSPLQQPASFWRAEAAYQAAQYERAQTLFAALSPEKQNRAEAATTRLRRAQLAATRNDWDAARTIAERLQAEPISPAHQDELYYLLGRCQIADAEFDRARTSFRRASQKDRATKTETAAMAQWMIGESFMHQENYQAAVPEYFRVVSLYPFPHWQAIALFQAAKCYERLNRHPKAAELYRQLQKDYPTSEFVKQASQRLQTMPPAAAEKAK